jgi:2-oxoglutarate dehydrogenase E1 component
LKKSTVPTAVPLKKLQDIGKAIVGSVVSMTLHPRVAKIYQARQKMYLGAERLDWGAAELLAYGSLLSEGFSLRLAGQDSQRGTFFHRHAVVCDQKTGAQKNTLSALCLPDKHCSIINSLLSEMAAMGFEYGYAMTDPQTLVIWEAQFGDFCNGAQVVIDQFISSGEKKWQRLSAITLFLPHGYEGQGPEHSSARIERFLQLAAQDNMRVVYPSTAAQMFHLLRSQIKATHRHPLIVFTPKSLLRLPAATSSLEEIATGSFQEILYDNNHQKPIRTIILCTGKIYYELLELQQKNKHDSALLVRIEQLYPFPKEALSELLTEYHLVHDIRWVQEEPANQGAWFFVSPLLREITPHQVQYRGRDAMAAPAVGSSHEHDKEQLAILEAAFS